MYQFNRETYENRIKWYCHDRFGMFIHFGLNANPARGEWVKSAEEMPGKEYQQYFEEFNPVAPDFHKWAKAAKKAGILTGICYICMNRFGSCARLPESVDTVLEVELKSE